MHLAHDTIILAGGVGSRLQRVVGDRPKCLAEINGRPFLAYLLDFLAGAGISKVILSTGYKADQIAQTFGTNYESIQLDYAREEMPLGTGGGLKRALRLSEQDHVLIFNGDSFTALDLGDYLGWFDSAHMKLGLALTWVEDCSRYGRVNCGDRGEVLEFLEKESDSGGGWINAGIYLLHRRMLDDFPDDAPFSLERDVFPKCLGRGAYGKKYRASFIDIGTPSSYEEASRFFSTLSTTNP